MYGIAQKLKEGTICVANQIRQRVKELEILHAPSVARHITISCGVVAIVPTAKLSLEVML